MLTSVQNILSEHRIIRIIGIILDMILWICRGVRIFRIFGIILNNSENSVG